MLTNARRVATVKAVNVCDLFILSKENLYIALNEFPEMRVVMEHVALNRLIKLRERVSAFEFVSFVFVLASCNKQNTEAWCHE